MTSIRHIFRLAGLIALLMSCFGDTRAQQGFPFTKELQFAQHLQDKEQPREAMWVLRHIDTAALSTAQKDSLYFQRGWLGYTTKQLSESASDLLAVSPASPHYLQARFFASYNLVFLHRPDSGKALLAALPTMDSATTELKNTELAGISLLQRDFAAYRAYQQQFTYSAYATAEQEHRLDRYNEKIAAYKHRSPLLAGVYSALLPGAGKVYAGKKKQGIAAFLPIATMGALTWEAWHKGGVKSARFLIYGSVFTVFYIGNIWGSVLSVKVARNEFNRTYDNQILFDMHIPLRSFFN